MNNNEKKYIVIKSFFFSHDIQDDATVEKATFQILQIKFYWGKCPPQTFIVEYYVHFSQPVMDD